MRIVEVAAEFAPIAKVGGLGDVLVGLSRELTKMGHTLEVILPKYSLLPPIAPNRIRPEKSFSVQNNGQKISNTIWSVTVEDCSLKLLEAEHKNNFFNRKSIYGEKDDAARFLYFSQAVVEYLKTLKEPIDILHLHDWHVAAIAPILRLLEPAVSVRAIVLTIHNVEYQGRCTASDLEAIGCKDLSPFQMHGEEYNLLKSGIEFADAIVPVSLSYAKEIVNEPNGFGLEEILRENQEKIEGIINGIDLHLWDPSKDLALTKHYRALESTDKIQFAKEDNRQHIANRFGLSANKRPWIGAITRLVAQKGPKFLEEALHFTAQEGGTFALLGSSPMPEIQRQFEKLQKSEKANALIHLEYDERLSHQLYAALDFFLIPSRFEPCGLTQMIAMRYGAIPIVHATGGLQDTVFDPEHFEKEANGFAFKEYSSQALHKILDRVFKLWRENSPLIATLQKNGMQQDFGWKNPAQKYVELFKKLAQKKA